MEKYFELSIRNSTIKHNYDNHDGQIPFWAAVEVMSFSTLSKYIKNLSSKPNSPFSKLSAYYSYKTDKGIDLSNNMLIHGSILFCLRNFVRHNSE